MFPFGELADDYCVFVNLRTKMAMPDQRETILHFFDTLRKSFPALTEFARRDAGEYFLEEDPLLGGSRFVSLEPSRLSSGVMKPESFEDADAQHYRALEIAPFHLGISPLDCEVLEVVFSYDFDYAGNHDALLAEALGGGSVLTNLTQIPDSRVLFFQPSMTLILDESCRLQCTLAIQTRTDAFQIRTGQFPESPISVFVTLQQYWSGQTEESFAEGYSRLRRLGSELLETHFGPSVLLPLARAIEPRR